MLLYLVSTSRSIHQRRFLQTVGIKVSHASQRPFSTSKNGNTVTHTTIVVLLLQHYTFFPPRISLVLFTFMQQQVSRTGPMPIAYPLTLFLKASSSTPTRYFHKSQVLDIIVQHCGFDKTACHALQILTKKLTLGLLEKQCNFENLCYVYVIGTGGKFHIFFFVQDVAWDIQECILYVHF